MMLMLGGRDFSLKRRCQTLENLHDKVKDARHARRSEARLSNICLTLL